jgi:hypothetical protein
VSELQRYVEVGSTICFKPDTELEPIDVLPLQLSGVFSVSSTVSLEPRQLGPGVVSLLDLPKYSISSSLTLKEKSGRVAEELVVEQQPMLPDAVGKPKLSLRNTDLREAFREL